MRRAWGNNETAIAMLEGVLEKKPGFYLGWYNIALAYSAAGNSADARSAYEKAVALDPQNPRAINNLALARRKLQESGAGCN